MRRKETDTRIIMRKKRLKSRRLLAIKTTKTKQTQKQQTDERGVAQNNR